MENLEKKQSSLVRLFHMLVTLFFAVFIANLINVNSFFSALFPFLDGGNGRLILFAVIVTALAMVFEAINSHLSFCDLYWNAILPVIVILTVSFFYYFEQKTIELLLKIEIVVVALFTVYTNISIFASNTSEQSAVLIKRRRLGLRISNIVIAATIMLPSLVGVTYTYNPAGSDVLDSISFTQAETATENIDYSEFELVAVRTELSESVYNTALQSLSADQWALLSPQEKLNVLQIICDHECIDLGCETTTLVSKTAGSDTLRLGYYDSSKNAAMIVYSHLQNGNSTDVLKTSLHELRHHYQHQMECALRSVDKEFATLQLFDQANTFYTESQNYISYPENPDYDAYANQAIEVDAREWAEKRINESYSIYLNS